MCRKVCGCPVDIEYDYINEVSFNEKYDKLSITPYELYLRQNGLCYLKVVYDEIDGEKVLGAIYCTDGKDYSETKGLLNPTNECVLCLTGFLERVLDEE